MHDESLSLSPGKMRQDPATSTHNYTGSKALMRILRDTHTRDYSSEYC